MNQEETVPIEVSARHVHLSAGDQRTLFGASGELSVERAISQPDQFVAKDRVTLVGPSGRLDHVAIVGPARSKTQVELTVTDARRLGIQPVLALSGDDTTLPETLTLIGPIGQIQLKKNVIVAKRHLHLSAEQAAQFKVEHLDRVRIQVQGERAVLFENVVVRSRPGVDALSFMIDTDEANAAGVKTGDTAYLIL